MANPVSLMSSGLLTGLTPSGDMPASITNFKNFAQLNGFNGKINSIELTPEILEELQELLPQELIDSLGQLLIDGNALPGVAADVAASEQTPDAANDTLGFPQLFALLHQYQQHLERRGSSPQQTVVVDAVDDATQLPIPTENARELMLRLKAAFGQPGSQSVNGQTGSAILANEVPTLPNQLLGRESGFNEHLTKVVANLVGQQSEFVSQMTLKNGASLGSLSSALASDNAVSPTALASVLSADNMSGLRSISGVTPPPLTLTPGQHGWDTMLGNRVMWMVGKDIQSASLKITPPNMGPIEIKVAVQQDQASVHLVAHHGVTREAIEAAIPRLREMFQDSNLQLVNVEVGQQGAGEQRSLQGFTQQANREFAGHNGMSSDDFSSDEEMAPLAVTLHQGLLDDYA